MPRTKRPLDRDKATYRDDRLLLIACDDTHAPKQYFNFFELHRVQVHVAEAQNGRCAALDVLRNLKAHDHYPDDELWLLIDTDHYVKGAHLQAFTAAIREARQAGIQIALSRPCFEVWLILHHVDEDQLAGLVSASKVNSALKAAIGGYNKVSLKKDDFPWSSVVLAMERARNQDAGVSGGEIPDAPTTRVYKLWDAILAAGAIPGPEA